MVQSSIYCGCGIGGSKFESRLKGRWGWFIIFHVKVMKKVTNILRMGKENSFLGFLGGQENIGSVLNLSCQTSP